MPLIPAKLAKGFESSLKSKSKISFPNAKNYSNEICGFIDKGVTALGGMPLSMGFMTTLAKAIADVWDQQLPAKASGMKEAMAVSDVLKMTPTSGGAHGTGSLMLDNPAGLGKDLGDINEAKLPLGASCKAKSMAYMSYLSQAPFQGTGIPPTMIPDISPLS